MAGNKQSFEKPKRLKKLKMARNKHSFEKPKRLK